MKTKNPLISTLRAAATGMIFCSALPKWAKESMKLNELMSDEVTKTAKKIGHEKTQQLVTQFKNEAYAGRSNNAYYIINKLRSARENKNKEA